MTDRNARNERSTERRQAEGVRIIGAEEAQKALEAGQVAGRRSDDELRFGDVPPTPTGPRPPHRFPLPDSVNPAEAVPRPPIAPLRGESPQASRLNRVLPEPETDEVGGDDAAGPSEDVATSDAAAMLDDIEPTGPLPTIDGGARAFADEPAGRSPLQWSPEASRAGDVVGRPRVDDPWSEPAVGADPADAGTTVAGSYPDEPGTVVWRPDETAGTGAPTGGDDRFDSVYGRGLDDGDDRGAPDDVADDLAPARASSWNLGERQSSWDSDDGEPAGRPGTVASQADDGWDTAATWVPPSVETGSVWARRDLEAPVYGTEPYGDDVEYGAAGYEAAESYVDENYGDDPGSGQSPGYIDRARYEAAGRYDEEGAVAGGDYETPRWSDEAPEADVPDLTPPEEGITVTGSHVLPHWTEPSEGVPSSVLSAEHDESDSEAWNALGAGGARWRDGHEDWDDESASATGFFADEDDQGPRLGVLDTERSDASDLYSFDEAFQQLEEERSGAHPVLTLDDAAADPDLAEATIGTTRTGTRRSPAERVARIGGRGRTKPVPPTPTTGRGSSRQSPPGRRGGSEELASRVGVGVGFVALLVIAYAIGPKALLVLAAAVVLLCAAEAYGVLQRCGFRPATLLGLTATGGLMFAAYWRGEPAVPLVVALAFAATMVWYLLAIVEARPLANVAVTSMTILWIGVLGAFAALMLRVPHGKGLFLGAVVVTVASDIVAYFVGRQVGHRPLAPHISPGKTVEGLVAGVVAAIVVGAIIGRAVTPWGGLRHGLLLGIVVAVFAPIGDLFESLIKRDLDVKDSGTALAGHGGLLDRFDSLLLVLPAVYYLADYLHLVR